MKLYLLLVPILALSLNASAKYSLQELTANKSAIENDLRLILVKAKLAPTLIKFKNESATSNDVKIVCSKDKKSIELQIRATSEEWSSTLYLGLQKLGFLFPHPRIQISPTLEKMREKCGMSFPWRPALKYRGFHLHTQHAGEWIDGFLMGNTKIAEDLINWLARNNQNIFDLYALRMEDQKIITYLKPLFEKARSLGVHPGITIGIAFHQQNAYKLVSLWGALFDGMSKNQIDENFPKLVDNLPISFLNVEMGTSEFTPVNYERMLAWLNQIGKLTKARNIQMMTKIHSSTNQKNEKYGNFNFLPKFASESVGILPHTVFYHALEDKNAPLYGNKNFEYMKKFMISQVDKRMTWYYPETSYFIALDIDVPLLLVEYLRTRTADMKVLYDNKVHGQLNFSTGQENGYWLMDWQVTLSNNLEYNFNPMIGLKLLGEDLNYWKKYMDFQKKYFTKKGLISIISFSNGGDELAPTHKILERNLLVELDENKKELEREIKDLNLAIENLPVTPKFGIDSELRHMVQITNLRLYHALYTRYALLNKDKSREKSDYLNKAAAMRDQAQIHMNFIMGNHNRYPESFVYKKKSNPSAYPFGYGYASSNMHFWKREEMMVKDNNFSVLYMNIWDFVDIVI